MTSSRATIESITDAHYYAENLVRCLGEMEISVLNDDFDLSAVTIDNVEALLTACELLTDFLSNPVVGPMVDSLEGSVR